jgi:hypothetical protein
MELWEGIVRTSYIDDVCIAGTCHDFELPVKFMMSSASDAGYAWAESSDPGAYSGGPVVDMAVSSVFDDVVYVTDGNYVYESTDGGMNFAIVAENSLETILLGVCGPAVDMHAYPLAITCLDVGYNGDDEPIVFIGVNYTAALPYAPSNGQPSVLYINEAGYPAEWTDLELHCFHASGATPGNYVPYSIGVAPNFATSKKTYVAVTNDDDVTTVATPDPHTWVISTVGITCGWDEVAELLWNCAVGNNFEIIHASRFAFSTSYASNSLLFIGVVDNTAVDTPNGGGDVYRVSDTPSPADNIAIDLNVLGYYSGCVGLYHVNICSLDIKTGDALIAGAWGDSVPTIKDPTDVYYSEDAGWNWAASRKDPTGEDRTYVLWYADSALAGTRGCDCGFSRSCGTTVGQYWNQIALIDMNIDETLDLSHAPGYLDDSSTMYVLTLDSAACHRGQRSTTANTNLLRWDGTNWERVFSSFTYDSPTATPTPFYALMDWVEVSPDFNTTGCLYLANTGFIMFRSMDEGCSWTMMSYPCSPRPYISAWIVVDSETVLTAGAYYDATHDSSGIIYKTTYHGAQPWTEAFCPSAGPMKGTASNGVDFDLSPNIANDKSVLFGDAAGGVYISQDVGATWNGISDAITKHPFNATGNTYVVFDPGYGTADDQGENMIYAAAATKIGRCNFDPAPMAKEYWVYISDVATCGLCLASGIDAAGDTALYVSDAGNKEAALDYEVSGTMAVSYNLGSATCDLDIAGSPFAKITGYPCLEALTIVAYDLYCDIGIEGHTYVKGSIVVMGVDSGLTGRITISEEFMSPCVDCALDGRAVIVLYSDITLTCPTSTTYCDITGVWRTLNPMDWMTPVDPVDLVEFEFLNLSATSATSSLLHPEAGLGPSGTGIHFTPAVYPDDLWLTAGSNMLWALDQGAQALLTTIWMWDDTLATPVIQLTPTDGAVLVTPTSATLSWDALDKATKYEVDIYSYCPACPDQKNLEYTIFTTETCLVVGAPDSPLEPGTTYYWKVRVATGFPFWSKWSDLWTFDTAVSAVPNLCSPICGGQDILITTNFSWDAVVGATSYEIEVATTEDFSAPVASGTATVNAWVTGTALDYSTTYYWRVRAIKDSVPSAWSVCLFTTESVAVTPTTTTTELVVTQEEITPMWIWVIIGIGAALVIAVIVLIVTTRRTA